MSNILDELDGEIDPDEDPKDILLCKVAGILARSGNGQLGVPTPAEIVTIRKLQALILHRSAVDGVETKR